MMAPPMQYQGAEIAAALRAARSLKEAAELLGMSMGAMRKRWVHDPWLRPIALKCRARGLDRMRNWRTQP